MRQTPHTQSCTPTTDKRQDLRHGDAQKATNRGENRNLGTEAPGGCQDPGLPEVPGAQRAARTHLDVVILGARHHQVVVARRLVYRQAHHGPDVAAQLPDGLQPTETGGWGQLSQKSSPKSFPQQAKVPPSPALTPRGAPSLLITPLGPKIPYYYYSRHLLLLTRLSLSPGGSFWVPPSRGKPPRRAVLPSPAQLPDADGVAGGGVERGAGGVERDLVDLVLPLHAGDRAGGGPGARVPRDHLARRSRGRRGGGWMDGWGTVRDRRQRSGPR